MAPYKKIICEEGGSRSSKTYSIFQFFLLKALRGEHFTLTICRDKLTWLKETLLKDFEDITTEYDIKVTPAINRNRPEQIYYIGNAEFTFWGLDTPAKVHGKKQDYVWINEAMDVDQKSFEQLELRTTTQIILDYNPVDDLHWVFTLQKRSDVGVIRSTMLDNPFLPDTIIKKIKSYEPTPENIAAGTADLYMWEVYGQGKKARLQGAVFTNWDVVDEIPEGAKFLGDGLDFGYTNDPSTLIAVYLHDNELYLDELFYKTGLVNSSLNPKDDTIIKRLTDLQVGLALIMGDSSEPKSIEEIRRAGFNIKGVEKGPDSVLFGIDIMKGYKIHITKRSINLDKEMRRYKWSEDKNGKSLNIPIDEFNHAIDAARYLVMTVLKRRHMTKLYNKQDLGL